MIYLYLNNECKRTISILTLLLSIFSQYSKGKRRKNSLVNYGVTCKQAAKTSNKTLASSTNLSLNPSVVDDLHLLEFKFTNNGGHPDEVLNDQNFRNIIDYGIEHATSLKPVNFKHISPNKLGIQ